MNRLKISCLFIILIVPLKILAHNLPVIDFTPLKDKKIDLIYDKTENGKTIELKTSIFTGQYENNDVIISITKSDTSHITVYLKMDGTPVFTSIIDRKKKVRYVIKYNDFISITKIQKSGKEQKILKEKGIDSMALSLVLSFFPTHLKTNKWNINIIDYINTEIKSIELKKTNGNMQYKLNGQSINVIKYSISSFILYDTVFYYGKTDFPVLIDYEGPASINFLDKIKYRISEKSYFEEKKKYSH